MRRSQSDDESIVRLAELARGVAEAPADAELDRAGRARLLFNVRRELERPSHRVLLPLALAASAGRSRSVSLRIGCGRNPSLTKSTERTSTVPT